jgi:hypothetical protein
MPTKVLSKSKGLPAPSTGTKVFRSDPVAINVNVTVPGGNTVANTASETNFSSNYSIVANSLKVGNVIKVRGRGVYGTDAVTAGTLNLKIKVGSTVLLATGTITNTTSITNKGFSFEADLVVTAIGGSGAFECQGLAVLSTTLGVALIAHMTNTSTVTVDTTTAQTLQASATFSVADTDNTITLRQFIVEIL